MGIGHGQGIAWQHLRAGYGVVGRRIHHEHVNLPFGAEHDLHGAALGARKPDLRVSATATGGDCKHLHVSRRQVAHQQAALSVGAAIG